MSSAITGCFLAVEAGRAARGRRRGARRVRRRGRGRGRATRAGRASFHVALYDALAGARPGDARRARQDRVRLHAIVADLDTARRAVEGGATVVQLRVKAPTAEVVARGPAASASSARRSSSTTTSRRRSSSAPTACTSASPTRAPSARSRRGPAARPARRSSVERGGRRRAPRRRLPRRRAGLGDAVEGGRRPADRPRRARRGSARRCRVPVVAIGGIDASNARGLHPRRARRASPSSARRRDPSAARGGRCGSR